MEYSQDDNLLIQSYFTVSLLGELNNQKFLESDYFNNLNAQDKFVHENIKRIGIDNQGSLLIFLYTLLVIPKQLLENKYPAEFNKLNSIVSEIATHAESSYKFDNESIDYVGHIRNAVAHARVKFKPQIDVTFSDKNQSETASCSITIPLSKIGLFLSELQRVFFNHIKTLKK